MFILYYIIPILVLGKILNYFRVSNKTLETQYKLLALSNDLRFLALTDKVSLSDPLYKYLDSAVYNSARCLKEVNFWVLLYILAKHMKDEDITTMKYLEDDKNESDELKKIFSDFGSTLFRFFYEKSQFSIRVFVFVAKIINSVKRLFKHDGNDNFFGNLQKKFKYLLMSTTGMHSYC